MPNFIIDPFYNIIVILYHFLFNIHIPYALGFSIILLTIIVRLILYPFTATQLKATAKMQKISPHLAKLKEKHKGDTKTLHAETMKLYKEHGVNPAAGCAPLIIQIPIIWGLYGMLGKVVNPSSSIMEINKHLYNHGFYLTKHWDTHFIGIPLGDSPSHLLKTMGVLVVLIPVLTALFQFLQTKMISPVSSSSSPKKGDFASAFATQSLYIFPLMIGFFSFTLSFGLSLYWNTFTIFGILQQYKIQGLGGLQSLFAKKEI
jgi:YidC/Oxa1 family membrane protein insertase